MLGWEVPYRIEKFAFDGTDPCKLAELFNRETPFKWGFGPSKSDFECRLDALVVGDFWIGRIATETGYVVERDEVPPGRFQIHFVTQGCCHVASDLGATTVNEEQVHISRSRRFYRSELHENTNLLLLNAPIDRYSRLVNGSGDPFQRFAKFAPVIPIQHPVARIIHDIAMLLLCRGEPQSLFKSAPLSATILKEAIFQTLIRDWPYQDVTIVTPRGPAPRYLRRALEWIDGHLGNRISVADLAQAAGTSPRNLQGIFSRQLGVSPVQYIIRTRLRHVHEEPCDRGSSVAISAIAKKYGFARHSEFERQYRDLYGQTPSQTRKSFRWDAKD